MDHSLTKDNTVAEVMELWPQTIPLFMRHRCFCVGCHMASFCTLDEASQAHNLEYKHFLKELEKAISQ
jgi:hybrid cluster-associated redox disulfide protein